MTRPVIQFTFEDFKLISDWLSWGHLRGMCVSALSKLSSILFTLELSKKLKGSDFVPMISIYYYSTIREQHSDVFNSVCLQF